MQGEALGQVQAVGFEVVHRREVPFSLADDHVAGGAGATAAARVFERDAEVQRHVQDRAGLAMFAVREPVQLELGDNTSREKSHFRH